MYIPFNEIMKKYGVKPKGVCQVGVHWAEEHEDYLKWGINKFIYIEPCKEAFGVICKKFNISTEWVERENKFKIKDFKVGNIESGLDVRLLNCACGAEEKEVSMYISHQNQGQSNSILKSNLHSVQHPEIIFDDTEVVEMITLDSLSIKKEDYNILVSDCEGYDGEVMKGAKETLKHIDLVYSEINRGETREGNMLIEDFEELLWEEGFVKIKEFWPSPNLTWGDAIFIRKSFIINTPLTSEDLDML